MKAARRALSALLLGGLIAPQAPHALFHVWGDSHFHRHDDGVEHSHPHEADHHEHELDSNASPEARLLPSRAHDASRNGVAVLLPSGPRLVEAPRFASPLSPSHRPGAPPGRRAFPHLGRAPPA